MDMGFDVGWTPQTPGKIRNYRKAQNSIKTQRLGIADWDELSKIMEKELEGVKCRENSAMRGYELGWTQPSTEFCTSPTPPRISHGKRVWEELPCPGRSRTGG